MKALETLRQAVEHRHDYARQWQARTGGRALGYLCTYVPEELIYAAGILPVRVLGSHEPEDVTEPHIFSMFCALSRDCLAQGLLGRYSYLDGIVTAQSCIHMRQAYDSWQRHVPTPYSYYLYMPSHVQSPHAIACLAGELIEFRASLEQWTGKQISDQDLWKAIDIYNTNRRLLRQIYELRKADAPPLSGVQAMDMVLASMVMDKEEHSSWLRQALVELAGEKKETSDAVRLMLVGSETDDRDLIRLIESLGAQVVVDEHCSGSRYFWNEVQQDADPLYALAQRYIQRPPCPQKDLVQRSRFPHILKLAQDYRTQGAIFIQQVFCDPHEFDIPVLQAYLQDRGIPSLCLEVDVTTPSGQFRTRIEAFLEMLKLET